MSSYSGKAPAIKPMWTVHMLDTWRERNKEPWSLIRKAHQDAKPDVTTIVILGSQAKTFQQDVKEIKDKASINDVHELLYAFDKNIKGDELKSYSSDFSSHVCVTNRPMWLLKKGFIGSIHVIKLPWSETCEAFLEQLNRMANRAQEKQGAELKLEVHIYLNAGRPSFSLPLLQWMNKSWMSNRIPKDLRKEQYDLRGTIQQQKKNNSQQGWQMEQSKGNSGQGFEGFAHLEQQQQQVPQQADSDDAKMERMKRQDEIAFRNYFPFDMSLEIPPCFAVMAKCLTVDDIQVVVQEYNCLLRRGPPPVIDLGQPPVVNSSKCRNSRLMQSMLPAYIFARLFGVPQDMTNDPRFVNSQDNWDEQQQQQPPGGNGFRPPSLIDMPDIAPPQNFVPRDGSGDGGGNYGREQEGFGNFARNDFRDAREMLSRPRQFGPLGGEGFGGASNFGGPMGPQEERRFQDQSFGAGAAGDNAFQNKSRPDQPPPKKTSVFSSERLQPVESHLKESGHDLKITIDQDSVGKKADPAPAAPVQQAAASKDEDDSPADSLSAHFHKFARRRGLSKLYGGDMMLAWRVCGHTEATLARVVSGGDFDDNKNKLRMALMKEVYGASVDDIPKEVNVNEVIDETVSYFMPEGKIVIKNPEKKEQGGNTERKRSPPPMTEAPSDKRRSLEPARSTMAETSKVWNAPPQPQFQQQGGAGLLPNPNMGPGLLSTPINLQPQSLPPPQPYAQPEPESHHRPQLNFTSRPERYHAPVPRQPSPPRRGYSPPRRQPVPPHQAAPLGRFDSPPRHQPGPPPPERGFSPPRRQQSPPRRYDSSQSQRMPSPPRRYEQRRPDSPPRERITPFHSVPAPFAPAEQRRMEPGPVPPPPVMNKWTRSFSGDPELLLDGGKVTLEDAQMHWTPLRYFSNERLIRRTRLSRSETPTVTAVIQRLMSHTKLSRDALGGLMRTQGSSVVKDAVKDNLEPYRSALEAMQGGLTTDFVVQLVVDYVAGASP